MLIQIDTDNQTLSVEDGDESKSYPLYEKAAFEILSYWWVKMGWNQKHSYTFTWMGRPLIQLPEDVLRIQELIFNLKPDVIVETGIAHGGSLIFYASLFEAMGKGTVIGVDIEIRPQNREAIENHPMAKRIQLIEGSSTAPEIVANVRSRIPENAVVLVILDSDHSRAHVADELEAYHSFVTPGSYIVATDGIMSEVHDVPIGNPGWTEDNPTQAAVEFVESNSDFILETPAWSFNESELTDNITYWPGAWVKKVN